MEVGKTKGPSRCDAAVDALDILIYLRGGVRLAIVRMPSCQSGTRGWSALTFRTSMMPARILEGKCDDKFGCRFEYSPWITHGRNVAV